MQMNHCHADKITNRVSGLALSLNLTETLVELLVHDVLFKNFSVTNNQVDGIIRAAAATLAQ